jgi:hypothetical protein
LRPILRAGPRNQKPIVWNVYKIAAKAVRLGTIETPDEAAAIEKAATESRCWLTSLLGNTAMSPLGNAAAAAGVGSCARRLLKAGRSRAAQLAAERKDELTVVRMNEPLVSQSS